MKKTEYIQEKAEFLKKEVRRIVFNDVKKGDIAELYNDLIALHRDQRKSKLWVCVGRHDTWFNNPAEMKLFLQGLRVGMLLIDNDFLDDGDQC